MSVAKESMPLSSKGAKEAPPLIGIALIAGGLLLLGWLGWALFNSIGGGEAPYHYRKVAEGKVGKFPDLGLAAYKGKGITIRKYELLAEEVRREPLVELYTGSKKGQAPVLLEWENSLSEPVLTISGSIDDLTDLAQAVTQHIPSEAVVLSWWDTSRQLELLTDVNTLFDGNLAQPLLIPAPWSSQQGAIEALEHKFWQVTNSSKAETHQRRIVEAFLADEITGASMLRELAGGREAYVVVHWSDAYKLGAIAPERFGIGFKNFPGSEQIHGLIPHVKDWLNGEGYEAYLVERPDDNTVRAYYLIDDASKNTLMAKMLPFNTSNPMKLEALQLVAQYGGYWVYSLPSAEGSD